MKVQFRLPDLGEGLTESEIVSWHVSAGDPVKLNQVIAEVETAKAVVELPSPYTGTVSAIMHEPGTVVEVGEVIIEFDVAAEPDSDSAGGAGSVRDGDPARYADARSRSRAPISDSASAEQVSEAEPKRVPTLVGYGADPETSARPVRRARTLSAPAQEPKKAVVFVQVDRPRSTPPVRKLARDMGVGLEEVAGTGERGLITRADVLTFAQDHAAASDSAAGDQADASVGTVAASASGMAGARETAREVRTPIKGVQKFMAKAMVESAFTAPHVSEFLTIDVTAGMDFLEKLRSQKEFAGIKVTPLTLAAKAVTLAVARYPALNSHWDETAQEVVTFNYLNLGIAAATPRGLVVPNIKDTQELGLRGLAQALGQLAETARAGKTPPADLAGGTFSITNIGVFGIDAGTPLLNTGEAGILALGAVRRTPWEYQGQVALRQVMTLSLSFDHRLVDGAQGSRFLADVGAIMADPAMALVLS
ncbi:dihydrolipoamide acetyltransferase family protein [Arthrobacter sp.]|uniref:dihydrolipoamide acetyltransferase family protein n=1 Tax=Arthrobacter sp. TaxID=1667 RepID=UPI0026E079E8|nr:dihydrolipoamide acetyltransferase family protein [Arthrobacter sp.]MDO5754042.1 dihydrolipoamide acetyltransferase family protein [Arthrobacter sp.]